MRPWLLLAPLLLALAVLLVAPVGSMLADGFHQMDTATFTLQDGYTLANFRRILLDGFYLGLLARTLRIAGLVTVATLVLAYPAALHLSAAGPRERGALMLLITAPLMVSLVIRSFGWIILLGPRGLVNTALVALGLTEEPLRLMYNEPAVVAGMAQVYFPFMVLAIFAALAERRREPAPRRRQPRRRPCAAVLGVHAPAQHARHPGRIAHRLRPLHQRLRHAVHPRRPLGEDDRHRHPATDPRGA